MNAVIQKAVSPKTALSVGLKVDADALPASVIAGIKNGTIDLNSPSTTVTLIKLNAVVGVMGKVDSHNNLVKFGITCALCHSTVDNRIAPGIGSRLDGWPNRELNPGAIIALSPAISASQKAVYNSWGPGRYDPRFNFDHINGPVIIPPAYGLADVNLATFTGDGSIEYWNEYVAVTQMHGMGNFSDPRTGVHVTSPVDLVSSKLPALAAYEHSLSKPTPPPGIDMAAAARGQTLFQANCSVCHSGALFTDANVRLHPPNADGTDPQYALRSATKMYRTTPLRGLAAHPPYFHDGSAKTLADVVTHYNTFLNLKLTAQQQSDLAAYLSTL
jgi:mono/diheme cytochrome c family protein